ncbi:MAG: histidinol-phosphatase [Proteobacteria bacterium]|nr:histidinol-phosphatase [Pseudomonadota bacterium]
MSNKQRENFLGFATEIVEAAGRIALQYFRSPIEVDSKTGKANFDPVTAADREIEAFIRTKIIEVYPGHSIIGEEQEDSQGSEDFKWIIDPIDGTRAFISGSPMWGILLGLMEGDKPVLGLMHQPYLQETFVGSRAGAFIRKSATDQSINTRSTSELTDATLYCTHPSMFSSEHDLKAFNDVAANCQLMRFGGDCYAYCMLAHGLIDLVIEGGLQPYDIIPLIPIIEAAGGIVTNWQGGSALSGGNVIAAANAGLHEKAMMLLSG